MTEKLNNKDVKIKDFKLLGKFKGNDFEFMKFDVALHQLLNKYNILWKEVQYVEEELKR